MWFWPSAITWLVSAENNAASNGSNGDYACIQRNKELIEKGSDAQSSCTKPGLEAESDPVDNMQEFSPLKYEEEAHPSGAETQEDKLCVCKNGEASTIDDKDADPEHFGNASNINVNFIGNFDFSPQLDISLRRSCPSSFENELTEERHTLMQSNASAFKRQLQATTPTVLINFSDQQREPRTNAEPLRTQPQLLHPTHPPLQESKPKSQEESNLITASLVGNGLPVAPSFGYELGRDQTVGRLVLNLKANGKLRWKVGTWVSGRYRFTVNCVSVSAFGPSIPAGPLTSKQGAQCSTTI
uniref:Uncharacterized protein n=1 Tax=Cajanus cajan TaxID=3821 RepID=A0A151R7Y1_CAJCA|nr:hypothetical protein KK1_040137 [Cajanus cajan]